MGSSPRGRGKPPSTTSQRAAYRLIPAWAGKTVLVVAAHAPSRAHPRAGGENPMRKACPCRQRGSSPRGRGKRVNGVRHVLIRGLIPAWAGKTGKDFPGSSPAPAHPRAGGENRLTWTGRTLAPGSSPRGRGKLIMTKIKRFACRLIPARAGKTCHSGFPLCSYSAHPRAGGENWVVGAFPCCQAGSSQRGRGKRTLAMTGRSVAGLIPARAGKTRLSSLSSDLARAHPRAGGENGTNV